MSHPPNSTPPARVPAFEDKALAGVHVLLVNPLDHIRRIVQTHLPQIGAASVSAAHGAAEAMKMLRTQPVDIAICAWELPESSGLRWLQEIRASRSHARLPVILTISEPNRGFIEQAIRAGVSDLLVTPFSLGNLVDRVRRALGWVPVETRDAQADGARSTRPTLLLVDDVPDNLHLLAEQFKSEYRVRATASGEKGIAICQSDDPPDLLLLDIMMPGLDGFEVARRLREHPTSGTIPIIFVTAMVDQQTREKAMELGAIDFVTKPVDPHALVPRVRNFMRYVQLRRQLQADYDNMLEMAHLRDFIDHATRQDLRRPLAGVLELLRAMTSDGKFARREFEQLRAAENSVLHTLDTIDLWPVLLRIEAGQLQPESRPVAVGELLRRLLEVVRTSFSSHDITIVADTDLLSSNVRSLQFVGDAKLAHALFYNLLVFACESAPRNSRIAVAVADTEPLLVTIRWDTHLPEETRERLFERRVPHALEQDDLPSVYSARLLAQAQQGSVTVHSEDGHSSVFKIGLRRHHAPATGGKAT